MTLESVRLLYLENMFYYLLICAHKMPFIKVIVNTRSVAHSKPTRSWCDQGLAMQTQMKAFFQASVVVSVRCHG